MPHAKMLIFSIMSPCSVSKTVTEISISVRAHLANQQVSQLLYNQEGNFPLFKTDVMTAHTTP